MRFSLLASVYVLTIVVFFQQSVSAKVEIESDQINVPIHNGTGNLGASPIGTLIYDYADGSFKGKAHDGLFVELSTAITGSVWFIDSNIGGGNPSLGIANQSSYVEITDGSLTLTQNSGSDTVFIACSGTENASGTTCTGNESLGISFTPPGLGPYLACASYGHNMVIGSSGGVTANFQLIETPNTSQTILQEGKSRMQGAFNVGSQSSTFPARICGTFNFSTSGRKTIRLMYEQTVAGTINSNLIVADQGTSNGQRDVHWEVYRIK